MTRRMETSPTARKQDSTLSLYHLLDPEVLANPYPLYHRLRSEDPVHWDSFLHAWVATRYTDVMSVFQRFSANRTPTRVTFARSLPRLWLRSAVIIVLTLVLYRSIVSAFEHRPKLQDQDRAFEVVSSRLAPGDRIYVHGMTELLVLLDHPNMNPYIFLDRGKDEYVARKAGDGFGRVVDQMESLAPKIVALSRLAKVAHRGELEDWTRAHYDRLDVPGYDNIYIRKDER